MSHELAGLAPLELPASASLVQLCRPLPAVRPIPGAGPEEAPRIGVRPVNRLRRGGDEEDGLVHGLTIARSDWARSVNFVPAPMYLKARARIVLTFPVLIRP